jgi:hypothetical protein
VYIFILFSLLQSSPTQIDKDDIDRPLTYPQALPEPEPPLEPDLVAAKLEPDPIPDFGDPLVDFVQPDLNVTEELGPDNNQRADPGSLQDDDVVMDDPIDELEEEELGEGDIVEEDAEPVGSILRIEDIEIAQEFINMLKDAMLDDCGMKEEDLHHLRNPPNEPLDLNALDLGLRLSLKVFLATTSASEDTYKSVRAAILEEHIDDNLYTLDMLHSEIGSLTGIAPIIHHMCIKSCLAYTGPFQDLDRCPKCSEPRYQPGSRDPRQKFYTIPLGPVIQALFRHPESATHMRYSQRCTEAILAQLRQDPCNLDVYDDWITGSDYLEAIVSGKADIRDVFLMMLLDGAQLYQNKVSTFFF